MLNYSDVIHVAKASIHSLLLIRSLQGLHNDYLYSRSLHILCFSWNLYSYL